MIGTRSDLAFAVGKLTQHCEKPLASHWTAVKRVLRYISGTHSQIDERIRFLLAGGAVSWRSGKQTVVATSSCEAEYIASCLATKEELWLSRILSNIHGDAKPKPVTIHIDNSGSIATAQSTSVNQRNEHVNNQYHFVRDNVTSGKVILEYVSTTDQLADPMTKPLDCFKTERLA
eukprot:IDg16967t1